MVNESAAGQVFWSRVAGGSLALTGVGHLTTELLVPKTPEQQTVLAVLRELHVAMPGAERSVAELFMGFSLIMGALLIGGGIVIATARPSRSSSVTAVVMTASASLLAWRYLFVIPGALTTIALVAAVLALWRSRETA